MPTSASVTLSIQYTPPSAATNSGNAVFNLVASFNAQNVGQIDVNPSDTPPTSFPIPFGSVAKAKILVIKNSTSADVGVRLNGGLAGAVTGPMTAGASVTAFSAGVATVTGLSGMVAGDVGGTLTLAGAASGGNNGTFTIASLVSATSVTIVNPAGVASDVNNPNIYWQKSHTTVSDNFQISAGGELAYVCQTAPATTALTSASVVTTAAPSLVESLQYWVFGD